MKYIKFTLLVCIFFITNLFTGCENPTTQTFFTDAEFPEQEIAQDVVVTAELFEYDRNVEKIRFTVTNNGDEVFGSGEHFRMQKMEDGEWREVAVVGEFNLLEQVFNPGTTSVYSANIKDHVKLPLPSGQYRIGIGYTRYPQERDTIAFGQFTVK